MSFRFFKAIGDTVFKTREDEIAEEQFELFGRGYARQRAEIDYWRGWAKIGTTLGLVCGALAISWAELRFDLSLIHWLAQLRR